MAGANSKKRLHLSADQPDLSPLAVALDLPDKDSALNLAAQLLPVTNLMKVGLELFTAEGPPVVHALKQLGCRVFLDLKFHDIPNTVRKAVRSALALGVDICNIHLSGGEAMCRAAAEEVAGAAGQNCLLLGVTVLTSTAPEQAGGAEALADLVLERAVQAQAWGLDGVVCSAWEAAAIKQACGPGFICLCPGIRPPGGKMNDQIRVMTPPQALRQGADFLVLGRPITQAANPLAAAGEIAASCRLTG